MIGFGNKTIKGINDIEITNQNELIEALQESNRIIKIKSDFTVDKKIKCTNSKITIDGNNHIINLAPSGTIYFQNCDNIIIENIVINGSASDLENNFDDLTFDNVQNIIVNNAKLYNGPDETVAIKNGSDWITFSNVLIEYNTKSDSQEKDHNCGMLIGINDKDVPESGKFHITFYKTTWKGQMRRCPRCRNTEAHFIECSWDIYHQYCIGPENSDLFIYHSDKNYPNRFITNKFGDYKCLEILKDGTEIKHPKYSEFKLPDYTYILN